MRTPDEDAPVAIRGRFDLKRAEAIGQHDTDFGERDRSHRGHRPQVGQHAQDVFRLLEKAWRDTLQTLKPVAPCGPIGPLAYRLDERQRECAQMLKGTAVRVRDVECVTSRDRHPSTRES